MVMKSMHAASRERRKVQLALVIVQLGFAGYYVVSKVAMSDGVNRFVFAAYRDCLGLLLLAPVAYFAERQVRTNVSWRLCGYIFLLGFTGTYIQQTALLSGLTYTNASFASTIQTTVPVFTVLISIVCGVEIVRFNRTDGIAKIVGVCVCVTGALIASLYLGPAVIGEAPEEDESATTVYDSGDDGWLTTILLRIGASYWQIGSLYLITNCLSLSIHANLMVPALRIFPAPISLTMMCVSVGTVLLVVSVYFNVSDSDEWVVTNPAILICAVYSGAIACALNATLNTWATYKGGPIIVSAFVPLQIVFTVFLGLVLFHEPVFLGSVIGAVFILSGLYLVIWAQARQQGLMEVTGSDSEALVAFVESAKRQPLLS